jgi:hypothetical protein
VFGVIRTIREESGSSFEGESRVHLELKQTRSRARAGDEKGLNPSVCLVVLGYLLEGFFGIDGTAEADGGINQTATGYAGTWSPSFEADLFGERDHEVEFIGRYFEVIGGGTMGAFISTIKAQSTACPEATRIVAARP